MSVSLPSFSFSLTVARKALTEDEFEKKRQAALSMLENCINSKI